MNKKIALIMILALAITGCATKTPEVETPVVEPPVVEEPVVEEPVVEEPVVETPVVEEPVVEEPVKNLLPVVDFDLVNSVMVNFESMTAEAMPYIPDGKVVLTEDSLLNAEKTKVAETESGLKIIVFETNINENPTTFLIGISESGATTAQPYFTESYDAAGKFEDFVKYVEDGKLGSNERLYFGEVFTNWAE